MNKSLEKLYNTKKKDLDDTLIVSVWLEEFFGVDYKTAEKLIYENNPKEDGETEDLYKERLGRVFHNEYAVTQGQEDWWVKVIKDYLIKKLRLGKHMVEKSWWAVYLQTAPSIKREGI
jgi:hypothetical protein